MLKEISEKTNQVADYIYYVLCLYFPPIFSFLYPFTPVKHFNHYYNNKKELINQRNIDNKSTLMSKQSGPFGKHVDQMDQSATLVCLSNL